MTDQVDSTGVPIDDGSNVVQDDNESDQLLSEPQGALSMSDVRGAASGRYKQSRNAMEQLRAQYGATSGVQAGAYEQQKKLLDQATQRLLGMSVGPGEQEAAYRVASAYGQANGVGGGLNASAINQAHADILKEQREAEMGKQQMLAQYGMQGPQSTIGAANAKLNQLTQQMRIEQSNMNNSAVQQGKGLQQMPWYVKTNQDGTYALQPGADKVMDTQAMSKLFGRFTLLPQPDGTKKIVTLGSQIGGGAGSQPPSAPAMGGSPAGMGAQPQPAGAQTPPGPAAPPGAAQAHTQPPVGQVQSVDPATAHYADLFTPSTVLDPKYGALTPATKPAYIKTAAQAFDPGYFKGYEWRPTHMGDDKVRTKQVEAGSSALAGGEEAGNQIIYNYGQALSSIDAMGNDDKLRTGPTGAKIAAFQNAIRGISPGLADTLTNDKDLKALSTAQDTDKYFLQAASAGLKSIYGGRITNMEVKQRMNAMPSNNLLPSVTRMLASAQADVAQDAVNKSKLWSEYLNHNGDPNPSKFNTWYEANFSPFQASRLKDNLGTAPPAGNAAGGLSPERMAELRSKYGIK